MRRVSVTVFGARWLLGQVALAEVGQLGDLLLAHEPSDGPRVRPYEK
jgi:hypothetical protein